MAKQRRWLQCVLEASKDVPPTIFPWHRAVRHKRRLQQRAEARRKLESA